MSARFNPPPGWPPPPSADWIPPPGWLPDPAWPAIPDGWKLVVDSEVDQAGVEPVAVQQQKRGHLRPSPERQARIDAKKEERMARIWGKTDSTALDEDPSEVLAKKVDQAREAAAKGKATEYAVANYDGSLKRLPEAGLSGAVEVKSDGTWKLNLGFRKHTFASFAKLPFEITPLSAQACRITIRSVDNPNFAARFDLPETAAAVIEADLTARGFRLDQMMAAAAD